MRGTDRSPDSWASAAALFLGAAVVVVVAAGIGPIDVVQPGWLGEPGDATGGPALPAPSMTMPSQPPADEPSTTSQAFDIPWELALAAIVLMALALAVYLLKRLPRRTWRRPRRTVVGGHVEDWPDVSEDLIAGARSASELLSGSGSTGAQAVIEAWLALESAAAGSGAPRNPAQTPSEFTAALLRRHHADEHATTVLLGLYHRARFSPDPGIGPPEVAAARDALTTILRTLTAPATAGREAP